MICEPFDRDYVRRPAKVQPPSWTAERASRRGPGAGHLVRAGAIALSVHACLAEARQSGRDAFAAQYGNPGPLRNCVNQHVDAYAGAIQACAGDRKQLGGKGFLQAYGKPHPMLNCVNSKIEAPPIPV